MIQEIKEYDSDTCSKIGIRIQDIRESRHMKAIDVGKLILALVRTRCLELKVEKQIVRYHNCIALHKSWIALLIFLLFGEEHMNIRRRWWN